MKIFMGNGWESKINFVDKNNVFVGFDYSGQWCEQFGFAFNLTEGYRQKDGCNWSENRELVEGEDKNDYVFDKIYRQEYSDGSEGTIAEFRLTAPNLPDVYLSLYNYHNGYYAHGFEFCDGETVIFSGIL